MKRIFLVGLLVLMCGVGHAAQWQNAGTAQLPGTINVSDIDYNMQNYVTGPLNRLLAGYRAKMVLTYSSASQLTVTAGEVMVENSDASVRLVLRNTSSTTVTWADLDTGSEAVSTTYYLYAIAATSAAETATFKISASSTAPSGVTYYAKLGSFYNNASGDISLTSIANESVNRPIADIRDFGSSASSYTSISEGDIKIAYGTITVQLTSSASVSNLPFESSSSYVVTTSPVRATTSPNYPLNVTCNSGSQFTLYNPSSGGGVTTFLWYAIGK